MNENNYLAKRFYSKRRIKEIEKKIKLLGMSCNLSVYSFLNIRTIGTIIFFVIGVFFMPIGYIVGPVLGFLYYIGCGYFLIDRRIKIRQRMLEEEALSFFEILTLSLETGRNLQEAFSVTCENNRSSISSEFREVLRQVNYGKSLTEAMRDMVNYIPSDTINNIIVTFTDANIYGGSIIDSLYTQLDYLRDKRRDYIKEEISKVPIKVSIISVFFFIPLILLIILGPVLLEYIGR